MLFLLLECSSHLHLEDQLIRGSEFKGQNFSDFLGFSLEIPTRSPPFFSPCCQFPCVMIYQQPSPWLDWHSFTQGHVCHTHHCNFSHK